MCADATPFVAVAHRFVALPHRLWYAEGMAYIKITRYGCRPLGYGPLVLDGEPVLRWQHVATRKVVFTCPDIPGFGWRAVGDSEDRFSSSLRAIARRLDRETEGQ